MDASNTPTLRTERLILRRFAPDDLPEVYRIFSDREVNEFLPWFPLRDAAEAEEVLRRRYLDGYANPVGYNYAVCLREDDVPIGYVNVDMDESHDLGYGLLGRFWHRGIITEACRAVIEQLRRDGLPYITATHDVNNPRSGAVMRRLGMSYRYSYEEQWQPKDIPVIFRMYQLNLDGNDARIYGRYREIYPHNFVEPDV